ncbi:hypothetical protein HK101_003695 [Irineochytrium annulatum]|nr:hypothetical protein HK101_003695 [Irineochytrium annulatum]
MAVPVLIGAFAAIAILLALYDVFLVALLAFRFVCSFALTESADRRAAPVFRHYKSAAGAESIRTGATVANKATDCYNATADTLRATGESLQQTVTSKSIEYGSAAAGIIKGSTFSTGNVVADTTVRACDPAAHVKTRASNTTTDTLQATGRAVTEIAREYNKAGKTNAGELMNAPSMSKTVSGARFTSRKGNGLIAAAAGVSMPQATGETPQHTGETMVNSSSGYTADGTTRNNAASDSSARSCDAAADVATRAHNTTADTLQATRKPVSGNASKNRVGKNKTSKQPGKTRNAAAVTGTHCNERAADTAADAIPNKYYAVGKNKAGEALNLAAQRSWDEIVLFNGYVVLLLFWWMVAIVVYLGEVYLHYVSAVGELYLNHGDLLDPSDLHDAVGLKQVQDVPAEAGDANSHQQQVASNCVLY